MMSHRRHPSNHGFTLVEILIVMVILAVVTVPFMTMVSMSYAHYHSLAAQVDLKAEAEGAAAKIFRRIAVTETFRIDPDNRGLTAGTARVHWGKDGLVLQEGGTSETLTTHAVTEFVAVRRGPRALTIFITISRPSRQQGREVTWFSAYDHDGGVVSNAASSSEASLASSLPERAGSESRRSR